MKRQGPPPNESAPPCPNIGRALRPGQPILWGPGLAGRGCRGGAAVTGGPPERSRPERRSEGELLPGGARELCARTGVKYKLGGGPYLLHAQSPSIMAVGKVALIAWV